MLFYLMNATKATISFFDFASFIGLVLCVLWSIIKICSTPCSCVQLSIKAKSPEPKSHAKPLAAETIQSTAYQIPLSNTAEKSVTPITDSSEQRNEPKGTGHDNIKESKKSGYHIQCEDRNGSKDVTRENPESEADKDQLACNVLSARVNIESAERPLETNASVSELTEELVKMPIGEKSNMEIALEASSLESSKSDEPLPVLVSAKANLDASQTEAVLSSELKSISADTENSLRSDLEISKSSKFTGSEKPSLTVKVTDRKSKTSLLHYSEDARIPEKATKSQPVSKAAQAQTLDRQHSKRKSPDSLRNDSGLERLKSAKLDNKLQNQANVPLVSGTNAVKNAESNQPKLPRDQIKPIGNRESGEILPSGTVPRHDRLTGKASEKIAFQIQPLSRQKVSIGEAESDKSTSSSSSSSSSDSDSDSDSRAYSRYSLLSLIRILKIFMWRVTCYSNIVSCLPKED